jgi:hypothetical protein
MREADSDSDERRKSESALTKPDRLTRIAGVLKWFLVGVSVWYLGSYVVVALLRIGYPFLLQDVVLANYVPYSRTFSSDNVFWTRTGMRTRPEFILVPRADITPWHP